MPDMAAIFALGASLLNLIGYIWYDRDLLRGTTRPNLSSWFVWTGITLLSVSSYVTATGDIFKSALSWSILLANIVTFALIVQRAKFSMLSKLDIAALMIGCTAALFWFVTASAWWGNIVIQIAIIAGGIPTYVSVWRNPANEKPGPWLLWGLAFICAAFVVVFRWVGNPLELVYPIIGVVLYSGIGVLALRRSLRLAV